MKTKPRIIFLHIPKTGGTSLRCMLLEEYGQDAVAPVPIGQASHDYPYSYLRHVDPLVYQQSVQPNEEHRVLMAHYDIRLANRLPEWCVMTMFRYPVGQLYSLYKYMRKDQDLQKMHPYMKTMSFDKWVRSEHVEPYLNMQTRFMSGHGTAVGIYTAISWLMNGRLVYGIMDEFNRSVELFNEQFGWSMTPKHLNAILIDPDFDIKTVELIEELQRDDMELYRIACEFFDTQFKED
ncbi:MAG: hypothetical protein AAFV93_05890 [Chloroflexota bacterium]